MNHSILLTILLISPVFALDYEDDIMPIFVEKCAECHSAKEGNKVKGGLRLDDPQHFHARFRKNSVVVPGDWDASYLFITLYRPADHDDAMPPLGKGERLTEEEVTLVQQWITEGAPINGTRGERGTMPDEDMVSDRPTALPKGEQDWVNNDGKTIRATVLRIEDDHVFFRLKNGQVYRYPITNLAEESRGRLEKPTPSD